MQFHRKGCLHLQGIANCWVLGRNFPDHLRDYCPDDLWFIRSACQGEDSFHLHLKLPVWREKGEVRNGLPFQKGQKNGMCKGLKVKSLVSLQTKARSVWLKLDWAGAEQRWTGKMWRARSWRASCHVEELDFACRRCGATGEC